MINQLAYMNMCSYKCCTIDSNEYSQVTSLSSVLKIVSDENRLKLLCILRSGQHCVCELIEHTKMSQSLISHHLKDFRDIRIVDDKKKGQWVYYSLTDKGKNISDLLFQIQD
jgi:ArsR family transcriptional regulator